MNIFAFAPDGFHGHLVSIEVDLRTGIPGTDIVGLPGAAIREARERVRAALRNSGFRYPRARVLVNLGPADVPKSGSAFDLGIACAILAETCELVPSSAIKSLLVLGELSLDGYVRPVRGVISAVITAYQAGITDVVVCPDNAAEAGAVEGVRVRVLEHLHELSTFGRPLSRAKRITDAADTLPADDSLRTLDFQDVLGQRRAKRAAVVAATGRHNVLLVGPPGSGKTMIARRLPGVLPPLNKEVSIVTTRLYSLAGLMAAGQGLIVHPPYRSPHHSASTAGLLGGGSTISPGEISLAHGGVLFLDEAPEFRPSFLQSLREPLEDGVVRIARAGFQYVFPACIQLILAANLCPCGNMGRGMGRCMCSSQEVVRYWKRVGGALLDRIDLRVPIRGESVRSFQRAGSRTLPVSSGEMAEEVAVGRRRLTEWGLLNADSTKPDERTAVGRVVSLAAPDAIDMLDTACERLQLSRRAKESILRVSATIAAVDGHSRVTTESVLEAVQHRRLGESESIWQDWVEQVEQVEDR